MLDYPEMVPLSTSVDTQASTSPPGGPALKSNQQCKRWDDK